MTATATTTLSTPTDVLVEGYLEVHRYLATATAALASATAALGHDDRVGAVALERAWRRLAALVEHHHRVDHGLVLPSLVERDPGLSAGLARLEVTSAHLGAGARSVTTALGWLVSGWRDRRAGTPEAVGATSSLARSLPDHLTAEEQVVLPHLAALPAGHAQALLERIERSHGSATIPFALATGTVDPADLPIGSRLAARAVWIPRYERDLAPLDGRSLTVA